MKPEFFRFLENKEYVKLKEYFLEEDPVEIAEYFSKIKSDEELLLVYRLLPKEISIKVFSYLDSHVIRRMSNYFTGMEITNILDELYMDDIVDLLEEMPAKVVQKFIANTPKENREIINQFLAYKDDSAGSIMTIEYVELHDYLNVKEALTYIKEVAQDKESISVSYVIDEKRHLVGLVSLESLVLSDENALVLDIMKTNNIISVKARDKKQEVANLFSKYDFIILPVVDDENRMVGIITIDDVLDALEEINTSEFQKMAAVSPMDTAYFETSIFVMSKNRVIWLLILMISSSITSSIISSYEIVLSNLIVIASFIPLLMDTSGNAGSQSSSLIIREISLGRVKISDLLRVFSKEFRISFLVGVSLAFVNFLRLIYLDGSLKNDPNKVKIAFAVSLALVVSVMLAKIIGGILPLIAKALRLDPTLMAGPLITTIADAITLVFYFTIISHMFSNLLT